MVARGRMRIAVVGGDGRRRRNQAIVEGAEIVMFKSCRDGGKGEARRLAAALQAGGFDRLIILTKWNGHSVTRHLRRIYRKRGISMELRRSWQGEVALSDNQHPASEM